MQHRLKGMRCYLSGAMDRVDDKGVIWRRWITEFLKSLGVIVLDPSDKKMYGDVKFKIEQKDFRRDCLDKEKFDSLQIETKALRSVDLRMVDISDFVIVYLDNRQTACGTFEELFKANLSKKPVLIVVEQGKKEAFAWLFGVIPHEHIFEDWDSLKTYLVKVHTDETVLTYKRWIFFDYDKLTAV